jgi:hypothetical protein
MNEAEKKGVEDEDAYANAYLHFHKVLTVLSEDAEVQCQIVGYFNVAWEIKDDALSNGHAVLNTVDAQLSEQQKARISQLLENVADIPDTVVNVPNLREAHLRAMSDPCWIPIRAQAKQLIAVLSTETDRVNAVLNTKRS